MAKLIKHAADQEIFLGKQKLTHSTSHNKSHSEDNYTAFHKLFGKYMDYTACMVDLFSQ